MLTLFILSISVLVAVLVFGTNEIRMRNRAIQSVTEEVRTYQRTLAQTKDELALATSAQRELLIHDGGRAIDHLAEITWSPPWTLDAKGGQVCFFCGVEQAEPARHRSNCRYMLATRLLEKHEETLRQIQRR